MTAEVVDKPAEDSTRKVALALYRLQEDADFLKLRASMKRPNLFRILGREGRERWHSAFWAWLLDPQGSHGLGDFILRRVLVLAANESGQLPVVRLERSDNSRSAQQWKQALDGHVLSIADVWSMRLDESVVAPGPTTAFSEVSFTAAADAAGTSKKAQVDGRFDVLLVARGRQPSGAAVTLVLVVEVKIGGKYEYDQLVRYSTWVHHNPSVDRLSVADDAFGEEMARLYEASHENETVFGLGLFVSPPGTNAAKWAMAPHWQSLMLSDLCAEVLEPAMLSNELGAEARPIVQAYVDLLYDPEGDIMSKASEEQRRIVKAWLERNQRELAVVVRVLRQMEQEDGVDRQADLIDAYMPKSEKNRSDKPVQREWEGQTVESSDMSWAQVYVEAVQRLRALGVADETLRVVRQRPENANQSHYQELDGGIFVNKNLSARSIQSLLQNATEKLREARSDLPTNWSFLKVTTAKGELHYFPPLATMK